MIFESPIKLNSFKDEHLVSGISSKSVTRHEFTNVIIDELMIMKVWSIFQPNTLTADSLCTLKEVKQTEEEIHGWSSHSFSVKFCVFVEYQIRSNSGLLNIVVKILN